MSFSLDDLDEISLVLKLLGDKTRLTMMKLLEKQECCVCELVEVFKTSQPSVSQHLRKLKDAGLVKENRKGQWIFYSINSNSIHNELIQKLLNFVPSQDHELEELDKKGLRISCN
ncbi:transcriptional regulator [Paenibacillus sp. VTT E-133280]|uniref:ArsR/SmtB family transcription factor n=1 Tax=unclassified Paenibacillus TaxID=185978 RepID=UPI000BA07673|nr:MULTISPECIES: metalloregulator ArsR/SmtB family transcription factor [unclassified Paenibacillus]MBY3621339.1 winged helix-turn-helix transcriptional regulator [Acinetobacter sp. CUI P1]MDH6373058.1 ArsR family transcriptional regulator [Paenibacillus sp. PastF-3]OZQ62273.1 transcriptional regulator [Paenibacillus sp. VTT E-133280]OZQ80913.1 transcriptional regulator [Paenibacillus sp. VTT E-133291]